MKVARNTRKGMAYQRGEWDGMGIRGILLGWGGENGVVKIREMGSQYEFVVG